MTAARKAVVELQAVTERSANAYNRCAYRLAPLPNLIMVKTRRGELMAVQP